MSTEQNLSSLSKLPLLLFIIVGLAFLWGCRTEIPFDMGPMEPDARDTTSNPTDTMTNSTDTTDTNPVDTSSSNPADTSSVQCDTSIAYFQEQILPIFVGSCAYSGCHDKESARHGIILDSYENIINGRDLVKPFNLDESEIYEKITEDDDDDRMPPAPKERLSQDQILLISKWILQGAENNSCDANSSGCDTTMVSFANDVNPILKNHCVSCHGGTNPNGGVGLTTYADIAKVANNGRLLGSIAWSDGFAKMPLGGDQLPDCNINTVQAWIDQGAKNN